MAGITIPIKIDGFECVEDMVQAVLNYSYKGRTLKEWADGIAKPKTSADLIRAMTDEDLAEYLSAVANDGGGSCAPGCYDCSTHNCKEAWLDWLKSPVEVET